MVWFSISTLGKFLNVVIFCLGEHSFDPLDFHLRIGLRLNLPLTDKNADTPKYVFTASSAIPRISFSLPAWNASWAIFCRRPYQLSENRNSRHRPAAMFARLVKASKSINRSGVGDNGWCSCSHLAVRCVLVEIAVAHIPISRGVNAVYQGAVMPAAVFGSKPPPFQLTNCCDVFFNQLASGLSLIVFFAIGPSRRWFSEMDFVLSPQRMQHEIATIWWRWCCIKSLPCLEPWRFLLEQTAPLHRRAARAAAHAVFGYSHIGCGFNIDSKLCFCVVLWYSKTDFCLLCH